MSPKINFHSSPINHSDIHVGGQLRYCGSVFCWRTTAGKARSSVQIFHSFLLGQVIRMFLPLHS